jgi:L-seryl-tRNA(Ser) seleniumtransferase
MNPNTLLQQVPGVDRILTDPRIAKLVEFHPRQMVVEGIRDYLAALRKAIQRDTAGELTLSFDQIIEDLLHYLQQPLQYSLVPAVNGTGIVLHTGLGRAPFPESAQKHLADTARHYCTLQVDPETGKRSDRYRHVEKLLTTLTGAEAAIVVNNNAAATLLILNTLAGGREVIVSRGELVEIGGSFRIPDVMRRSGAFLREVGTTNRTHLKDYRGAVSPKTGLLLRVHQSNYRIVGFTKRIALEEMVALSREIEVPLVDDLGSGALVDLTRWGLPYEPTVQESVQAGADVICFSGDKLLGGPQCGIILGKKPYIDKIKKNQLTRALRCDKMTFAVLEATLRLFLDEEKLLKEHPVIRMLTETPDEIKKRCRSLYRKLSRTISDRADFSVIKDLSEVGSGSLAARELPTHALAVTVQSLSAENLAYQLRHAQPPIYGRIKDGQFLLDARTLRRDEFPHIVSAFLDIAGPSDREERLKTGIKEGVASSILNEVRKIENHHKTTVKPKTPPDQALP